VAFDRAKTALATLEEKLRRALGLAGAINATFTPELRPVVITGDLREPGNAFYRGRHWAYALHAQYGAGTAYASVRFEVDMLITRMVFMPSATGACYVYYTSPDQAPAVAVTQNAGVWTDRKRVATDLVPLTHAGPAALAGTNFVTGGAGSNIVLAANGGPSLTCEGPMLWVPAGSALNFATAAPVQNMAVNLFGRVAEQVN
jgi:hypothetical protein